jgi:hypothetical protein
VRWLWSRWGRERPQTPARFASLIAAPLLLAACHDRAAPAPAPTASASSAAPEPDPAASARRPARRYRLTRVTAARCEITREDEAGRSAPVVTPCPLVIEVGESIRIAGKACFRESKDPARVEPVVCPDPLTNKEKTDLGLK